MCVGGGGGGRGGGGVPAVRPGVGKQEQDHHLST